MNIFDVNVKDGEKTQCEFEAEYGKGMAKFIKCDVSNKDVLTGNII